MMRAATKYNVNVVFSEADIYRSYAEELGFDDRSTATRLMAAASKWCANAPFDEGRSEADKNKISR
jgi:hypothetical protein